MTKKEKQTEGEWLEEEKKKKDGRKEKENKVISVNLADETDTRSQNYSFPFLNYSNKA